MSDINALAAGLALTGRPVDSVWRLVAQQNALGLSGLQGGLLAVQASERQREFAHRQAQQQLSMNQRLIAAYTPARPKLPAKPKHFRSKYQKTREVIWTDLCYCECHR